MRRQVDWSAAILVSFATITVLPILGIVLLSLQPEQAQLSGFELPDRLHYENYARAFDAAHFASYLQSSLIVSVAVVVGTVIVSTLSGYAFGTMRFAGENVLFYLLLAGLVIPSRRSSCRCMSSCSAGPDELLLVGHPAADRHQFLIRHVLDARVFSQVPRQLIEAAALDGAGSLRILWKVLLPGLARRC